MPVAPRYISMSGTNLPGQVENMPINPSADYRAMETYWHMVETILEGALAMRLAGTTYLPQFTNESLTDYEYRRKNAKFTNIYRDIVENLAAKPFAKEVKLVDGSFSTRIADLIEDIDGQGNHLHVFAAQLFFQSINDAVDWIFIDKTPMPVGATVADEKRIGARPYWVHVPAKRMLAVYSDTIDGKETIVHARIWEPVVVREGYKEVEINRVRELNRPKNNDGTYGPATYTLWEERRAVPGGQVEWVSVGNGPIAIGVIALVPMITGRRKGGSWRFVPPMQDAAHLQIEHYQQESNLKALKEQAAFPMLTGNGVSPEMDENTNRPKVVPTGPRTVLYAPRDPNTGQPGEWRYIEPGAQTLKFLAEDIEATEKQLRELGRQPLTANTGNLTVVTTAFAAQKGNSAIQAWALNLKDALERAFQYTCMWLGDNSQVEVSVHTDFAIDLESDKAPDFLLTLRKEREISRKAILNEAKRRDFLSPEYDPDEDQEELDNEKPAEPTPQDIEDALPPPNPRPPLRVVP